MQAGRLRYLSLKREGERAGEDTVVNESMIEG